MIVICFALSFCIAESLDESKCKIVERKRFVDIGFSRRKPGSFDIYVHCSFDNTTIISSPTVKFANPRNESVTEINGHDIKGLEYLPVDIVNSFPNVAKISIYKASLKTIAKKNFHGLNELRQLDLSYNQISSIDEDTFDDLTKIFSIDLDHNQLTSLPPKIFSKLLTLDTLHLNGNHLTVLDAGIFKNNLNLALLFVHENNLTTFASGTFDSLTKMRQIWFHKNEISSLNSDWFKNCVSISDFLASDNNITEIPLDFLTGMDALRSISFSSNPIKSIDFKMFENNKNIYDISFNDISVEKVLNIDVVDKLPSLQGVHFKINNDSCVIGSYHEGTLHKLKHEVKTYCKTE